MQVFKKNCEIPYPRNICLGNLGNLCLGCNVGSPDTVTCFFYIINTDIGLYFLLKWFVCHSIVGWTHTFICIEGVPYLKNTWSFRFFNYVFF